MLTNVKPLHDLRERLVWIGDSSLRQCSIQVPAEHIKVLAMIKRPTGSYDDPTKDSMYDMFVEWTAYCADYQRRGSR